MTRSRRFTSLHAGLALAVVLAVSVSSQALPSQGSAAPATAPSIDGLQALVARAEAKGLRTGVVVRDLRTGRILHRHRSKEWFIPASNQKLITAAVAVWGLGDDFRFRTAFSLRRGILEVHAGGDPNWMRGGDHDPVAIFTAVATRLRRAGVDKIRGVRLVSGRFTGPTRPRGWPKDQTDQTYCAPTGGLVLEAGCFVARISPGAKRARIELLAPPAPAVFTGRIKMTTRKKSPVYWLSHQGTTFRAHGEFHPRATPVEVRGVCQEPDWLFEESLRAVLRRAGVAIAEDAEERDFDAHVHVHESDLRDALMEMLRESSNFHAEQVLRVLGAECRGRGSFTAGCEAAKTLLAAKMKLPASFRLVDGSGLSRGNRVTPNLLASLVAMMCRGEHAKLFADCLAQGGVDGTLRRRFRASTKRREIGRAVRAKTGTINGVKALTGFVQTPEGSVRVFSILMNRDKGRSTRGAAKLQDAMVEAIYEDES